MAKRGNVTLTVINSQEQWNGAIKKPGMTLCDVYSQCWGPCVAIQTCFKQLQMEFGDKIKIALAESDSIEDLSQFRGKSQPLFVLYYSGTPVAFLKGANQPKLLSLVRKQVEMQSPDKKVVNVFEQATEEEEELAASMSRTNNSLSELTEFTVAVIKPDAVKAGYVDEIITELNDYGLIVVAQEEHMMTGEEVHKFYKHLENESYFLTLVEYMTSGPCVAIVLAKVTPGGAPVVEMLKKLKGNKDVALAQQENPDCLRAKFATADNVHENGIHASDNKDVAAEELAFFFPNFQSSHSQLERTICVIRPDTNKAYKESILNKLKELEFTIALQKEFVMSREMAEVFYRKQKDQPFFDALINQMISGPSTVLALCSKDAVKRWRKYLGPTVVSEAKETDPECMRAQFNTEDAINGLHGSGNSEEAVQELNFFFPPEQTLAVIKPDMAGRKDEIIAAIQDSGIVIQAEKDVVLSKDTAGQFYEEHKNKQFYGDLCDYMVSGKSTFLVLSGDNAVEKWRDIMGPTDPEEAKSSKPQSLRSKLGNDILKNGLHGASNEHHALKSIELIFGQSMSIKSSSKSSKSLRDSSKASVAKNSSSVTADPDKTENDAVSLPTDTPPTDTPRSVGNDVSDNTLTQGDAGAEGSQTELAATNETLAEETAALEQQEESSPAAEPTSQSQDNTDDLMQTVGDTTDNADNSEAAADYSSDQDHAVGSTAEGTEGEVTDDADNTLESVDTIENEEVLPSDGPSAAEGEGEAEPSADNGVDVEEDGAEPSSEVEQPALESEPVSELEEVSELEAAPEAVSEPTAEPAVEPVVESEDMPEPPAELAESEPAPESAPELAPLPIPESEPVSEAEPVTDSEPPTPRQISPTPSQASMSSIFSRKSKKSFKDRLKSSVSLIKSKMGSTGSLKSQTSHDSLKSHHSTSSLVAGDQLASVAEAVSPPAAAIQEEEAPAPVVEEAAPVVKEAAPVEEAAPAPEIVSVEETVDEVAEPAAAEMAADEVREQSDKEFEEEALLEEAESRIRDNLSEGEQRNSTPQEVVESEDCDTEIEDAAEAPAEVVATDEDTPVEEKIEAEVPAV